MTAMRAVLPSADALAAAVPSDLADDHDELVARVRIAVANAHVQTTDAETESAIALLQARAGGAERPDPFGPRVRADTYAGLADAAERAAAGGTLDLEAVLSILFETG